MHRYTDLQLAGLTKRLETQREHEWRKLAEDMNKKNIYASGPHVSAVINIGFKVAEELINKTLEFERTALSHEQTKPPIDCFDDLKRELIRLAESELARVRSKAVSVGESRGSIVRDDSLLRIQHQEASMRESINRQVDILQEELRLGVARSSSGSTIHVAGDVGAINTGLVYGSVQGKIERIGETDARLAEAFSQLVNAITESGIGDDKKREQLETVEFLAAQCENSPEKRNYGVIKASEKALSVAANLATIMGQVGPVIMKALGVSVG